MADKRPCQHVMCDPEECFVRPDPVELSEELAEIERLKQGAIGLATMLNEAAAAQIRAAEAERDEAQAQVAAVSKQLDEVLAIFGQRVTGRDTMTGEPLFWGDDQGDCLSPKDAILEAIETRDREKVREGMQRAADVLAQEFNIRDIQIKGVTVQGCEIAPPSWCRTAILAAMEKEGGE